MVDLRGNGLSKTIQVHLLVARAFLGEAPFGHEVNHKDGNKHNPALANLEYVTPLSNVRHSVANGLHMHGERHYAAKVTEGDVLAILDMAADGMPRKEIALRFGLSKAGLGHIIRGKNWKHLRGMDLC